MEIPKDFKELLDLFNFHKVEYLIVGGYALAFHGAPRFTGDIDFIANKRSLGRKKDLADIEALGHE
jgi:hypothetical protein